MNCCYQQNSSDKGFNQMQGDEVAECPGTRVECWQKTVCSTSEGPLCSSSVLESPLYFFII